MDRQCLHVILRVVRKKYNITEGSSVENLSSILDMSNIDDKKVPGQTSTIAVASTGQEESQWNEVERLQTKLEDAEQELKTVMEENSRLREQQ